MSRKMKAAKAKAIYAKYKKGVSCRDIAAAHGVSPSTVSRVANSPALYGLDMPPLVRAIDTRGI